jgi:transcriptional regulator with XRE-family HTH domain
MTKKTNGCIGTNIRLFRKQKGLTQVELAQKINCSQAIVTAYENNRKKPAIDTLSNLADSLGVTIDQIVGKEAPSKTGEKIKKPKLWKKFEQIDQLPDTDKRTVFRMIDGLLTQKNQGSR